MMFERNPLAVNVSLFMGLFILTRQVGGNSIADSFGVCNWRPDSETVASRAFAQASEKYLVWGRHFVSLTRCFWK